MNNMRKKMTDHRGATGIIDTASGYTINTKDGPGERVSCAYDYQIIQAT